MDKAIRRIGRFSWILLDEVPEWTDIESSVLFMQKRSKANGIIDSQLIDEISALKSYVTLEKLKSWLQNEINTTKSVEDKWKEIFAAWNDKNIFFPNLSRIIGFVLSLPWTNAPVERVVSLLNSFWSKEKNKFLLQNITSSLIVKVNFTEDCLTFYEKIKNNPLALKKIHSSEKYFWKKSSA